MDKIDPREKSDRYRKHVTVKFNNAKQLEFLPTQFLIDENYVGKPPRVQVSFENLNDNIDENFLKRDLEKLGRIRSIDIVRHPETRKHLGLARVQFEDPKVASCCVESFNGKQVMGKQLSVYHDVRFTIIERRKEEKLRPQPVVANIETPKIQLPVTPITSVFPPLPFPPLPVVTPNPTDSLPRSTNRQHSSLDERLAKLGLKQSGSAPQIATPVNAPIDKGAIVPPFVQNHVSKSTHDRRHDDLLPNRLKIKDEKPTSPVSSPVREEIHLTLVQISDEVLPYCYRKFLSDMKRNITSTLMRRLVFTYGYPCMEEAQKAYWQEKDKARLEKAKKDREMEILRIRSKECRFFSKDKVDRKPEGIIRPKIQMVRQRVSNQQSIHGDRMLNNDLRRVNRSAALAHELDRYGEASEDSNSERSYRQSRSLHRPRLNSGSRSNSRGSRTSSSPFSRSSSTSSTSSSSDASMSSPTSYSSSSSDDGSRVFKMETSSDVKPSHTHTDLEAAEVLVSLIEQPVSQNIKQETEEPPEMKSATKKRKKKAIDQENQDTKRLKKLDAEINEDITSPKKKIVQQPKQPMIFKPRDRKQIDAMINDLYSLEEEDLLYLRQIHQEFEEKHESVDQTRVPFGSDYANKAHLINFKDLKKEIESKTHPRWWNGCSRCSMIETSDRGKVDEEEMTYEDLTKAPIKSHVIQAAVSTRRDQRSDQRRIAALNPEIDPSFLKQFTANTLQMRAKNLRFSRSKIHQWGLFACEKIANGDAVIEYVGEKIRPSVADHRENIVYPSLPNHDGSSYFFRVDTDVIDASFKGNKARFINHSCNPNCIAKVIKHENGTNSIVIYAKQTINEDEEITYDYKFPREANDEDKIRCNCKAPKCHIWLN